MTDDMELVDERLAVEYDFDDEEYVPANEEYEPVDEEPRKYSRLIQVSDALRWTRRPSFLIDGVLPRDGRGFLYGRPGTFKTTLAIDLGLCVAAGMPWQGFESRQCNVLYMPGEGRIGAISRARAWATRHSEASLESIPFFVSSGKFDLSSDEDLYLLLEEVLEKRIKLIIIDPFTLAFAGDENSAQQVRDYFEQIDVFTLHGVTVLFVHHTGHTHNERLRGSIALEAHVDFMLRTDRTKNSDRVKVLQTRMKDHACTFNIDLESTIVPLGECDQAGNELTSIVLEKARPKKSDEEQSSISPSEANGLTGNQAIVYDVLATADLPLAIAEIATRAELKKRSAQNAAYQLKHKKLISLDATSETYSIVG